MRYVKVLLLVVLFFFGHDVFRAKPGRFFSSHGS